MIRLRTLGECAIEVGERRVGPESEHVFGLLLFLAIERGKQITRSTLVELFWSGASDEKARHCLRQALYKVRLLGVPLVSTASHIELAEGQVRGDVLLLAERGGVDLERLRVGGAAFGEFLPGYAPDFSPAFSEWLESKRDFVHGQVRRALAAALVECRSAHRWADVESVARHCLRLDPLNEEATLALAEATALTGSKAQALSIIDRFVAELGDTGADIRLPAALLRKRIAERLPTRHYTAASDALFVGRDDDLAILGGLLRQARAGEGQACLVWGDPGIGKTRLAAECAKGAVLQGARVQRVLCQASDATRPLAIFVDLVPRLQAMPGALGCDPESVAYLRRLTEHDSSAQPSTDAQEAAYVHGRIRRAILDLVDAVAEDAPLLLLVEDVHWLDAQSWDLLREMIDWAVARPIFVLLTSRTSTPTEQTAPRLPRRLVVHHVGALDATSSARLLDAIVLDHKRALDPGFRDWCVGVSEGNPLFLREMASQWVETGDATKVPATLGSVIGERLARVRPASMRLLQASAILGKNSTFERLEAVTDYKKYELLDAVEELEGAGLLVADGSGVQVRHELIARAALQRINEGARRLLHRNAARVLEAEIEATKGTALLWDYTAHCRAAGESHRMIRVITTVGAHLVGLGLSDDAAKVFEKALDETPSPEERLPLLEGLLGALKLGGEWARVLEVAPQVMATRSILLPLDSTHTEVEFDLIEAGRRRDQPLVDLLTRALACLDDERASRAHRMSAAVNALRLADNICDAVSAANVYQFVTHQREANKRVAARESLVCAVIFNSSYGDLELACEAASELRDFEISHGTQFQIAQAWRFSWIPLLRSGRLTDAFDAARSAYEIGARLGFTTIVQGATQEMVESALEIDDIVEAEKWYRESVAWSTAGGDVLLSDALTYLGSWVALAAGDADSARRRASRLPESAFDQNVRRQFSCLTLQACLNAHEYSSQQWVEASNVLFAKYRAVRTFGGQDFNVYCLAEAMAARSEIEKAHSMLSEYANVFRKETGPLPLYIRRLREQVERQLSSSRPMR